MRRSSTCRNGRTCEGSECGGLHPSAGAGSPTVTGPGRWEHHRMATGTDIAQDILARGRDALAGGDWQQAREHFRHAVAAGASGEAWEGLAWTAWWTSDEDVLVDAREQAFRSHRADGDRRGAARAAAWLASDLLDFRGADAQAAGWLRRAQRLLEDDEPCTEHGWLWLMQADLIMRTDGEALEA